MTDARGRLEAAIRDVLVNVSVGTSLVQQIADAVERALAPEPPAPLKVWPGLEEAERLYVARYNTPANTTHQGARLAGLAAAAPHLWRALVASLSKAGKGDGIPETENIVRVGGNAVYRDDLAALADPYDGGGKGVGQ